MEASCLWQVDVINLDQLNDKMRKNIKRPEFLAERDCYIVISGQFVTLVMFLSGKFILVL